MSAAAHTFRDQRETGQERPSAAGWLDQPLELSSPEALNLAFRAFNQLSSDLNDAYLLLQDRVAQLTREVEMANHQRLQEISEKERIASRLENLLQLLPGGVVVLNSQGQVTHCNPAAIELLGEPLEGQFWRDIIKQRFAPRLDDGHEISLKNGRRVSLATRSLQDEPGQIILLTDQTETRRLQQHLSRHQCLSAMGKMVSSLAHQIRTPLSAAMLYAGQLESSALTPAQSTRCAGKIMSRLHNMERQVKDMLIFARGDAVLDETLSVTALFEELQIASEVLLRMPSSVQVDDLVQSGMIGLLEAARKYDLSKGASFETYAGIRIRGAMLDEIRKGDWAPRSVHRKSRQVADAIKTVEMRTGTDARDQDVAAELEMSLEEYHAILQDASGSRLFSFDDMLEGDDSVIEKVAGEVPNPLDGLQNDMFRGELAAAIATLPEREQLVLALYYDEELNLKEIGQVLGVSESRVSQIHTQAALRLRSRLNGWD